MLKLASLSTLLATSVLLVGSLSAQRMAPRPAPSRSGMPQALPGLPMVQPPAGSPGLAGQPLMGNGKGASTTPGVKVKPAPKRVKADPSTSGVKLSGKDLKRAVAKVKALPWNKGKRGFSIAKVKAVQSGKPILLLQTLGDIGGDA